MAATTITRVTPTDDDGTGTTGTIWNAAYLGTAIYDKIDALFASGTFTFGGSVVIEGQKLFIGDTSNANMTTGLTINQGAAANEILTLKSSTVAHGVTTITETDTYGLFRKLNSGGGFYIEGLNSQAGVTGGIYAIASIAALAMDTAKTTNAAAALMFDGRQISGTGVVAMGANTNIAVFSNNAVTRFILDADGDSHQDVGTAWTNFDSHDDLDILNSLAYRVSKSDDPWRDHIRRYFAGSLDSMLTRQQMQAMKLVTFNRDGHHFVNMSKLTMLHTGAIRQLGDRVSQMEEQNLALAKQNVALLRQLQRERRLT